MTLETDFGRAIEPWLGLEVKVRPASLCTCPVWMCAYPRVSVFPEVCFG